MPSIWKTKTAPRAQEEDAMVAEMRDLVPEDVHHKLLQGGEGGLTEVTLKRFLRSVEWDVSKAAKRLASHADWRVKTVPDGLVSEEGLAGEMAEKKLTIQGLDKNGRAILCIRAKKHIYDANRTQEVIQQFATYALDTAVALNDPERNQDGKVIAIYDLGGTRYRNLDSQACRTVLNVLQEHYPERLAQLWLFDAPTIAWAVWKVVSPFIDPVTREKIKFVYGKSAIKEFQEVIDPELLPAHVGGTGKFKPVEDAAAIVRGKLTTVEM